MSGLDELTREELIELVLRLHETGQAQHEEIGGALVADFYGAYNFYEGVKQRCWVHLGRDLDVLVEKNPDLPKTAAWDGM